MVSFQPAEYPSHQMIENTGKSATFTSGPAAMLQSMAPGRCGGDTYATPPSGQRTILVCLPPT